ncbi:MAG: response regulator [Planctomycetota bacterium]|nr:response regulator [Planctomycetota bacterium]
MGRILVVDDNETIREVLSEQLALQGHSCDLAQDGSDGLLKVQEREYDVIISDIDMPRMNGIEFLKRIHPYVESTTPFMILTAYGEWEYAMEAIRLGACNFLQKPFDHKDVAEAVKRAIELREIYKLRQTYREQLESKLREKEEELRRTYDGTVIGFAAMMEGKDTSTMAHLFRVRDYCTLLAREMGVSEENLRDIQLGAMLHDIGKYRVPDAILTKPGPLTEDEWTVMRRHPEFGGDFVRRIPFLAGAADVILHHHERYDGTGYPDQLAGGEIPLAARIFSVVDAYDAIVSERCYKEAKSSAEAIAELQRCAGTQFDPRVVSAFERILPEVEQSGETFEARYRAEVSQIGLGQLGDRADVARLARETAPLRNGE